MIETSGFQSRGGAATYAFDPARGPLLTEKYWGFTIRNTTRLTLWIGLTQFISLLVGAGFLAAALGLWFAQAGILPQESIVLRGLLSVFFVMLGAILISYANRGTASELQFDQNLGEVREVVHNRAGKPTLVSNCGFDALNGLAVDRRKGRADRVDLILRHQSVGSDMLVASGTEAQIGVLFGRLERELLCRHGNSFGLDAGDKSQ